MDTILTVESTTINFLVNLPNKFQKYCNQQKFLFIAATGIVKWKINFQYERRNINQYQKIRRQQLFLVFKEKGFLTLILDTN